MDVGKLKTKALTKTGSGLNLARWADSTKQLYDSLTGVLESEFLFQKGATEPEVESFSRRSDIDKILPELQESPSVYKRNPKLVFAKLNPYFEIGFYLTRAGADQTRPVAFVRAPQAHDASDVLQWKMSQAFILGRHFQASQSLEKSVHLPLPDLHLEQVLRCDGVKILKSMGLDSCAGMKESSAFVFRVTHQDVFLLLCDRPHVWQSQMVEETFLVLNKIFGRDLTSS